MARLTRRLVAILAAFILVPAVLFASLSLYWSLHFPNSNILDFHPSYFEAKSSTGFFYSMGSDLKFSDRLDRNSPTLLRGDITSFLVSPDSTTIATVANGKLTLCSPGKSARLVTPVDSIYRDPKPVGRQFFRDDDFQWTKDSRHLYLIRDEYYLSKGSQLFSDKAELWRFDLETGNLEPVLKPFPAYTYFFGQGPGVYYSAPTDSGDLQLRYFDGTRSIDIGTPKDQDIPIHGLAQGLSELPFFSFSYFDNERAMLNANSLDLATDESRKAAQLKIGPRTVLKISQGEGFKGPYYCSGTNGTVFLPGDRFFMMTFYCGNYDGQLLFDAVSGNYMRLPKDTRIYRTANTDSYPKYRITGSGIVLR